MHIPDGYLGPATSAVTTAIMLPIWAVASKQVKRTFKARQVPQLAIAAAFIFIISIVNVPIPGGTTGHAMGAVLVAILLGPAAALIAVTVALAIQTFLFGDGGVTAFGANCFNMGFIETFAGYGIYRLLCGSSPLGSRRRLWAAGAAAYIATNLAVLSMAFMVGIQPLLHRTATGSSLYGPYGFKVVLPVMEGEHLLVFGWVEAIFTFLVLVYLQKSHPFLLDRPKRRVF